MTRFRYGLSRNAWDGFTDKLIRSIAASGSKSVCEIGGGANPAISWNLVHQLGLEYTVLDVSEAELSKCPPGFNKLRIDICKDDAVPEEWFDFVFSRMLAEHVRDPRQFHRNVFRLLKPGGRVVHFFPTLYSPPFVANYLLPNWLTEPLLVAIQPIRRKAGPHSKFPAFYRWCRGPSQRQVKRFESIGFVVEEYCGYFGHSGDCTSGRGYYDRLAPLRRAHEWLSRILARHPVSFATSYALVTMRKPISTDTNQFLHAA